MLLQQQQQQQRVSVSHVNRSGLLDFIFAEWGTQRVERWRGRRGQGQGRQLRRPYSHPGERTHTGLGWRRPGGERSVLGTSNLKCECVTEDMVWNSSAFRKIHSLPLFQSCNVYGFDGISSKCHLLPPPPSSLLPLLPRWPEIQ